MKTEGWTTVELAAEIEKIVRDLSVINHVGVVRPSLRRVLLHLLDLAPPPTTDEIGRAIDAMIEQARIGGNFRQARWLRAWKFE